MHDSASLFRFQEHDIVIQMVVLEELDAGKKGAFEVARNVRQASRFIDDIINTAGTDDINNSLKLTSTLQLNGHSEPCGRLLLQTQILPDSLPASLPGGNSDNSILGITLTLQKNIPQKL